MAKRSCKVCGCTEERACPGGCCWIGPRLCSACSPASHPSGFWWQDGDALDTKGHLLQIMHELFPDSWAWYRLHDGWEWCAIVEQQWAEREDLA